MRILILILVTITPVLAQADPLRWRQHLVLGGGVADGQSGAFWSALGGSIQVAENWAVGATGHVAVGTFNDSAQLTRMTGAVAEADFDFPGGSFAAGVGFMDFSLALRIAADKPYTPPESRFVGSARASYELYTPAEGDFGMQISIDGQVMFSLGEVDGGQRLLVLGGLSFGMRQR